MLLFFFFFQAEDGIRDVAVTGVQTCALPISWELRLALANRSSHVGCRKLCHVLFAPSSLPFARAGLLLSRCLGRAPTDRKSTRLNSSHGYISYAVFCLKKKNNTQTSSY